MSTQLDFASGAVAVFGGSGGVGSEICRSFAVAGCDVAFTFHIGADRARGLEAELTKSGVAVSSHQLDISDANATSATFTKMLERHPAIHTVVYASGPFMDVQHIADARPERFRAVIEGELLGFFHIVHATMPHLRAQKGSLVACVTAANRRVVVNDGQSAVPKGGIESLIRQLAREEGENGVRANAVALGWFDLGKAARAMTERSQLRQQGGRDMADFMTKHIPLGHRPGLGSELAPAVLFMASRQASYVTGQIMTVDGGASL